MPTKKDNSITGLNTNRTAATTTISTINLVNTTTQHANVAASSYLSASDLANEQKQQLFLANAKLCRFVRKCPWMYDRNHPNYAKKHILDKSWTKIAKDCNDSVASCKERWRNIRAAFARSINIYRTHGGPNRVKPYYLHKELCFLVKPMMDGRDRFKVGLEDTKDELTKEDDSDDCAANDCSSEADNDIISSSKASHYKNEENSNVEDNAELPSDAEADFHFPVITTHLETTEAELSSPEKRMADSAWLVNSNSTNVLNSSPKRLCGKWDANTTDADAKFLEALLPDMKAMNARQKIVFKRKIFQSLEEVFETTSDFPAQNGIPIVSTPTQPRLITVIPHTCCSNKRSAPSTKHIKEEIEEVDIE